MPLVRAFVVVLVLVLAAFPARAAEKESAYDRVMRTGVLRCGYVVYPPATMRDPNTGNLSGFIVDAVNEAAKKLDWKVEWATEVGLADMFEGLKTGKYDALCSGAWKNPARAKLGPFTIPINYGVQYVFTRANDARFDSDLTKINDPSVKIAILDGEYSDFVAKESFPTAQTLRLPQLTDISQLLESVATKKADIVFLEKTSAQGYLSHNPGKLKMLPQPVRVIPAPAVVVPLDSYNLKEILDSSFEFMLNNGEMEQILRKYNPDLSAFLLVAKPYKDNKP